MSENVGNHSAVLYLKMSFYLFVFFFKYSILASLFVEKLGHVAF